MRTRLWYEMAQCKHSHLYCLFLLSSQKRWLNYYNVSILLFSSAGIMGWGFWKEVPFIACFIISFFQIIKLIQPHILPSEKQIEQLEKITDFYFAHYNDIEHLWYDVQNRNLSNDDIQKRFYKLKKSERDISKIVNSNIKTTYKKMSKKADLETRNYLSRTFNI